MGNLFINVNMNCGQSISTSCEGKTFPLDVTGMQPDIPYLDIEGRSIKLVSLVVSIGTFLITNVLAGMMDSFSDYQKKGINALRCAFLNGFVNVWALLAALYYAARQFGQEA